MGGSCHRLFGAPNQSCAGQSAGVSFFVLKNERLPPAGIGYEWLAPDGIGSQAPACQLCRQRVAVRAVPGRIPHRSGTRDVPPYLLVYPEPTMRKGAPSRRDLSGK